MLLCNVLAYSGLFAFISGSPFVFIGMFGFTPQQMGFAFGVIVSGYMTGWRRTRTWPAPPRR